MSVEKGRTQYLGIKKEATRLTAETSGFYFLPWTSFSARNENKYRDDNSAFGARGVVLSRSLVSQHGIANFAGFCDADNLIFPLFFVFGNCTPTTANGATTWSGSVLPSIEGPTATIVYKAGSEGHKRIKGWMPTKMEINFSLDDATYSVDGFGLLEENGPALSPGYSTPNKYLLGRHVSVGYADTFSGLTNATSLSDIRSLKISYDTGVDIEKYKTLGSLNPVNNVADGFGASLEFDLLHKATQAATIQDWYDAGITKALRVTIEAVNLPPIGSSNLKPKMVLDFPESVIEVERVIELDELVLQKCKVTVQRSFLCTFQLVNSVAVV